MEKSEQESIKRAQAHLEKEEFNEGLAILKELPDTPEIEDLRHRLERERSNKIDELLKNVDEAKDNKDFNLATSLVQEAQALDGKDERVQAAAKILDELSDTAEFDKDIDEKKHRAQSLLDKKEKNIADLDAAIRLLNQILSRKEEDFEAQTLLDEAERLRSEFLKSQGQVATLEQAEEYEKALEKINDLIQRGMREFEGRDIFQYRGELESRAKDFAEVKVGRYMSEAEKALESDPQLALQYIDKGLGLPFIPSDRRLDLENLKQKAERNTERYIEAEKKVHEALDHINKSGDHAQAIQILEEVLGKLPNFPEAQRHLDKIRQGQKKKVLRKTSSNIAHIKTLISQGILDRARTEILNTLNELEVIDEECDTLRNECNLLLDEVNKKDQIARSVKKAVESVARAIKDGELEDAEREISALDKETQEHPEIRKLRTQLTRQQDIEDALGKARQSFEDGNLQSAREQIGVLKRRDRENKDLIHLYKEVESTFSFQQGEDAFIRGHLAEARKEFQNVIKLDTLYQEEAKSKIDLMEELKETDRKARSDYKTALKYREAQRFEEAYSILAEMGDTQTSVKEQIVSLRNEIRLKWRKQLKKQIQENLKIKAFEQVFNLSEKLEKIKSTDDSGFIYIAKKEYHVHKAKIESSQGNWQEAIHNWQEAQKYDADDQNVIKELREARIREAVLRADSTENELEAIAVLENILDKWNIDSEVYTRLCRLYIVSEGYSNLLKLLTYRTTADSKSATKEKIIKELCNELKSSKEKFSRGAHRESIEILERCLKKYTDHLDVISELLQRRKQEIIDLLLKEARESENKGESVVYILPMYREVLEIEPNHREAKQRNDALLEDFKRRISDMIQECIQMENDENIILDDIEEKIKEIQDATAIATDQQTTKLKPHLERLYEKRRSLAVLQKKITRIRGLLIEAKEDGDFSNVDRELSEAISHTSTRNITFSRIIKEIQELKDRRKKASSLTDQILDAYNTLNFSAIESLSEDLMRIDPDDEFYLQRQKLKIIDTFANQEIDFKELKTWAQYRRQNLQRLNAWFEGNQTDLTKLEQEENKLREDNKQKFDSIAFVRGLEKLLNDYKKGEGRLQAPPETALSERADKIVKTAEDFRKRMSLKAKELEDEASSIARKEQDVNDIIERAGNLIDQKKYEDARPLVEEGLEILPLHSVLRYYRDLIRDKHG